MPFSDLEIALAFVALLACLVAGGTWLSRGKQGDEPNDDLHSLEEKAASQAAEAAELLTKCTSLEAERSEAQAQLEQLQAKCKKLTLLEEKAASQAAEAADLLTKCTSLEAERSEAQAQLEQLQAECTDAREEAELTLLQLHQVQEELEHYFLLSQDLQQKLDQAQGSLANASEAVGETPSDRAALAHHTSKQLQRIKQRLSSLLKQNPSSTRSALWALICRQQAALSRFERLHRSATATIPAPTFSAASIAPIADSDVVVI